MGIRGGPEGASWHGGGGGGANEPANITGAGTTVPPTGSAPVKELNRLCVIKTTLNLTENIRK